MCKGIKNRLGSKAFKTAAAILVSLVMVYAMSIQPSAASSTISAFSGNYSVTTTLSKTSKDAYGSVYATHVKGAVISDPTTDISVVGYYAYSPTAVCASKYSTGGLSCAVTAHCDSEILNILYASVTSHFCGGYENSFSV